MCFGAFMIALWALGLALGRRRPAELGDPETHVVDAAIALLGLLLAFTFAMSLGRHDDRRLTVVAQSNAIGDFYTCVALLEEPHRSALQSVLREYVVAELELIRYYLPPDQEQVAIARSQAMHDGMTQLVGRAIAQGTPIAVPLTNTLNALTSANASRVAAYEELLPWNTQLLLVASGMAAAYLMGRQQGQTRKSCHSGTLVFFVLVSLVIFVVLDLNQPRRGSITVNVESMKRLAQSMK